MIALSEIKARLEAAVPGLQVEVIPNGSPSGQESLWLDNGHARGAAEWLRDNAELRMDYVSNVTGVDWPARMIKEKVRSKRVIDGLEREIEETVERTAGGYLEAVYHLYSMEKRLGPLVVRLRTQDRTEGIRVPSLTPVWRGAEFQEREVFDLFGIVFEGHPDLRRILMWEDFKDYPMRRDYVEPDDFEYEPTPHDEVLEKARRHYPQ